MIMASMRMNINKTLSKILTIKQDYAWTTLTINSSYILAKAGYDNYKVWDLTLG